MGFIEDFLFFGTKKIFLCKKYRKIYRKNIENYAYRMIKNIFIYLQKYLDVQTLVQVLAHLH